MMDNGELIRMWRGYANQCEICHMYESASEWNKKADALEAEMKKSLAAGSINTAIYTSPHATADLDPLPALLAIVKGAKTSILFSFYAFTLPTLAAAIIARHDAGVSVSGVCDETEYREPNSQLPVMSRAGIQMVLWGNQYRLNHEKVIIVDGSIVALGSFNFTTQAETENKEVLLILSGKQVEKILAPTLAAQIQATYAAGTLPPVNGQPKVGRTSFQMGGT